jgi:hypothetical protein
MELGFQSKTSEAERVMDGLSMSVGRDYRSGSAYEYVIYRSEEVVARQGFFRGYAQAKRAGLKAAEQLESSSEFPK